VFQLHVTVVNSGEFTRVLTTPRRAINVVVRTFPDNGTVDIPTVAVSGPVRIFGGNATPVAARLLRASNYD